MVDETDVDVDGTLRQSSDLVLRLIGEKGRRTFAVSLLANGDATPVRIDRALRVAARLVHHGCNPRTLAACAVLAVDAVAGNADAQAAVGFFSKRDGAPGACMRLADAYARRFFMTDPERSSFPLESQGNKRGSGAPAARVETRDSTNSPNGRT